MKITRDYNGETLANKINDLLNGVIDAESNYNDGIVSLENYTNSIDFTNVWKDPVQERVKDYVDTLKSDTELINNDITSGSFHFLITKLKELQMDAESFRDEKIALASREEKLKKEKQKDEGSRDQNIIDTYENAVKSAKAIIDREVERINILLSDISKIKFNESYHESELPLVMIEPVNVVPQQPEEPEEPVVPEEEETEEPKKETKTTARRETESRDLAKEREAREKMIDSFTIGGFLDYIKPGQRVACEIDNKPGYVYKVGPDTYLLANYKGETWTVNGALDASAALTTVDKHSVVDYTTNNGLVLNDEYEATWNTYAGKMQKDTNN